ncbi:MAG: hypothetical protein IJE65_00420 [Clostridia bacterium]|nr:hypothetical protein [Clostridia bacterium]
MNVHLILKEGDEDLVYLRNFLPPKSFGNFINAVIKAERIGGRVIFAFGYDPFGKENGYLDLRLAIKGKQNIEYVSALPSRKRTIVIKELIRKQIKFRQADEIEWLESEQEEQRAAEEYERRMQEIRQRNQQK